MNRIAIMDQRKIKTLLPNGQGNHGKNTRYVKKALAEVNAWETQKPGFVNQVADFVLGPAEKAANALIPDSVIEAVGKAIEATLSLIASQTTWTFDADGIRASVKARVRKLKKNPSVSHTLRAADEQARELWNWHIGYAAAEGAATGGFGLPGIAADIPALFAILIREIQEIGTCYGYDVTGSEECDYLLHVLRTGSTTNVSEKIGFVVSLKEFEQILIKVT
jgi:EcsC protein family